jgi:CRISPR system Cascade subunit CasD
MSPDSHRCLALSFEGPLQSWGIGDRFSLRKTASLPSKSAVLGLCCAALGAARGGKLEQEWLPRLNRLGFLAVAVPRQHETATGAKPLTVRRMEDYHTVQNSRTADGKTKDTHITHRTYLNDARFVVLLEGDPSCLAQLAAALRDPVWGIWLGRKACIPSAPILRGLFPTCDDALESLIGSRSPNAFTHLCDEGFFGDASPGNDSHMDQPTTFADPREFLPRRVSFHQGVQETQNQ